MSKLYRAFGDLNIGDRFRNRKTGDELIKIEVPQCIDFKQRNAIALTGDRAGMFVYYYDDEAVH